MQKIYDSFLGRAVITLVVAATVLFSLSGVTASAFDDVKDSISETKVSIASFFTPKTAHAQSYCSVEGCGGYWDPGGGGDFNLGGWAGDLLNSIDNWIGTDLSQYGDALDLVTGMLEEMGVDFGVAEDLASWVEAAEGITDTVQNIDNFEDFSNWASESGNIEGLAGSVTTLLGLGEEYDDYDEAVSVVSDQISAAADGYSEECDGDEDCNVAKYIGDEIKKQIESASDQIDELDTEFDDMEDIGYFLEDLKRYTEMIEEYRRYQEETGGGDNGGTVQWCYNTEGSEGEMKPEAYCYAANNTTSCFYADEYDDHEQQCETEASDPDTGGGQGTCYLCQSDTECGDGRPIQSDGTEGGEQCFADQSTCQGELESDDSSTGSCFESTTGGGSGSGALSNARFSESGELLVKETRAREKDRCLDALAQETSKKVLQELSREALGWIQSGFDNFGETDNPGFIEDLGRYQVNTSNQRFNEYLQNPANFQGLCGVYEDSILPVVHNEYAQDIGSAGGGVDVIDSIPSLDTTCPLEENLSQDEAQAFLSEGSLSESRGWDTWGDLLQSGIPAGVYRNMREDVSQEVAIARDEAQLRYETGEGFRAVTENGEVVTPSSAVSQIFNRIVNSDLNRAELVDEMNEVVGDFGNLFTSQLINDSLAGLDPEERVSDENNSATSTTGD